MVDPHSPVSLVITFLVSGGGAGMIINAWFKWRDGRALQEKEFNQRAIREAQKNERVAEVEAYNRRVVQEYCSQLIRLLHVHGVDELPEYPRLEKPPGIDSQTP